MSTVRDFEVARRRSTRIASKAQRSFCVLPVQDGGVSACDITTDHVSDIGRSLIWTPRRCAWIRSSQADLRE